VSPKKAWEYLAMFLVLGAIYYCDLNRGYQQGICNPERDIYFSDLPLIFLKYFLYTA
jgi:hypothetical protein